MYRKIRYVETHFNTKTNRFEKLDIKAPKGQRRIAINQDNQIIIYDDKGNIVAVKNRF